MTQSNVTVQHHVHKALKKLQVPRRAMAMRRVREASWIAVSVSKLARDEGSQSA